MIGQGILASLLDRKPYRRPKKTILEQIFLVPTETLLIEIPFIRLQLDLSLVLEKTFYQNKLINIPSDQPIVTDNTTPIPKPGLGKQPIKEKNLGIIDIDIDTLINFPYSP
jgi:hypothetical protein